MTLSNPFLAFSFMLALLGGMVLLYPNVGSLQSVFGLSLCTGMCHQVVMAGREFITTYGMKIT